MEHETPPGPLSERRARPGSTPVHATPSGSSSLGDSFGDSAFGDTDGARTAGHGISDKKDADGYGTEVMQGSMTAAVDPDEDDIIDGAEARLERFEIVEKIGSGGMGDVYSGWDNEFEQEVALKAIKPELARRPSIMARFRREAKLARRIQHVNVAQTYDVITIDGADYLCMEYVKGRTLDEYMREQGDLPLEVVFAIMRQLCSGVQAAHDVDVVHRDLKPANVIIARDRPRACILDFGIAYEAGADDQFDRGQVIGSPRYMAPEQLAGEQVTPLVDVYALGLLFYEMVFNRAAFPYVPSSTPEQLLEQRMEPPAMTGGVGEIPAFVVSAIERCLQPLPNRRHVSAQALLDDLDAHRERELGTSGRQGVRQLDEETAARPRVLVAVEDEQQRTAIAERVESIGCEAIGVADGVDAIGAFMKRPFGLVILDADLPRVDGLLAFEILKRHPREADTWTVFVFDPSDGERRRKARATGAFDVLDKPVDGDALASIAKMLFRF